MDGQQYLDQISETTSSARVSSGKGRIPSSKFFIAGVVGAVGLVLILILGMLIGGAKKSGEKELGYALMLHLNGTAEVIDEYQSSLRSSTLRSHTASLYSIITNTRGELDSYLSERYKIKDKDFSGNIAEEAALSKDALMNELFESKINGMLDGVFASKMAYEIALITNEEVNLIKISKNERLTESLTRSHDSLTNLYDKFNDFSETNY